MESLQNLLQSAKCFGISVLFDTVRLSSFHLSSIISWFFFLFALVHFKLSFSSIFFSFILLAVCCLFCLLFYLVVCLYFPSCVCFLHINWLQRECTYTVRHTLPFVNCILQQFVFFGIYFSLFTGWNIGAAHFFNGFARSVPFVNSFRCFPPCVCVVVAVVVLCIWRSHQQRSRRKIAYLKKRSSGKIDLPVFYSHVACNNQNEMNANNKTFIASSLGCCRCRRSIGSADRWLELLFLT